MKKLNRLNIKVGNQLKDEELKKLRGGTEVMCALYFGEHYQGLYPYLCNGSQSDCDEDCASGFLGDHPDAWCICNYGY